jgi:hypothetical protein
MSGMFSVLFSNDGVLKTDAKTHGYVRDIRQVCFVAYKTEIPYAKRTEQEVIDRFIYNESVLNDLQLSDDDPLLIEAANVIRDIFTHLIRVKSRHDTALEPWQPANGETRSGLSNVYTQTSIRITPTMNISRWDRPWWAVCDLCLILLSGTFLWKGYLAERRKSSLSRKTHGAPG